MTTTVSVVGNTTTVIQLAQRTSLQIQQLRQNTVVNAGPGVQGPPGLDGAAASFDFTQPTPASPWVITHMLGKKPIIDIRSAGGVEMIGEVVHVSDNQTNVYFITPQAGTARLI
jgi:hypothetical protein